MRKQLLLALFAVTPLVAFGQNAASRTASKTFVYPNSAKLSVQSLTTQTSNSPAAYCIPVSDCTDGDLITNVTVAGINNTTTCSPSGYGNYTAIQGTIVAGQTYPISVTVGDGWFERVSVWADWNNNEIFEASEFLGEIGDGADLEVTTLTGNISVPAALGSGSYRLRITVNATGSDNPAVTDACEAESYGETEDYTLVVAAPPVQGCLTAPNGIWPANPFTPNCNGANTAVTTAAYAGEYSIINVTSGIEYTFSVSKADYYITIADATGTTAYAAGTGSVTWTANATGPIRFYSHVDSACTSGAAPTIHTRSIKCGTPPPPPVEPDYGCDQTYTGTWSQANAVAKSLNYAVANDFFVPKESGTYRLQNMTASFVRQNSGIVPSDIQSFDVVLMSDSGNNSPGTVIHTWSAVVPTVSVGSATFANFPTYDVSINLSNYEVPVDPTADTRYWISLQLTSISGNNYFWIGYDHPAGWITAPNHISTDNGATYNVISSSTDSSARFESVWSLDAECSTAAVSEAGNREVSFYPNPVRDFLTLTSRTAIETVHIYNVSGQKMPVSSKIINGKVDMSKLAPGVYIVSTILQNGKNESFKVIKK